MLEQFLNEKKPKGAPDFHQSDAPEAEGRFKELGIKELAAWLIKTRNKDIKKISGSLTQQVVFNRNDDPEYAEKMEKVRKEVYKQLGREDLLDNMKESFDIDDLTEGVKVVHNRYIASHGKAPKGFGKWAFSYDRKGEDYFFVPNSMSFTDAVKWVKSKAVEDNKYEVFVMEGINDFSPLSYAKKVANKVMTLADAAAEANMSMVELLKLVRKFDKNFKMYTEAEVNEKMKVFMNSIIQKMIPAAFGASSNVKMREEMKAAVAAAIEPILKKYDYIVEQEEGRDTLDELNEMTLGQLERIEDYAEMIADRMEEGQQLESWMFSQITVALENLNAVHDGMDGSDGVKEGFSMDMHIDKMRNRINEKAKGDRGPLDNPDIEVALKKKAEESGIDIGLLRIVMRRGMDAWNSGHREGMGQEQWGYARVNAFIDKGEGTWGGADKDVAAEVKKK